VLENRVAPAKNLSTVRQMVDAFPAAAFTSSAGAPALYAGVV
jgi:hypothetical protein